MPADITPYLNLITSEHRNQPDFVATVSLSVQPSADDINVALSLQTLFDIDIAVGQQEDFVGQWVGITRELAVPLTGVYFSLDSATLGLDQGYLQGPFDPTTGLVSLNDDTYRTLLRATIAANQWDGTIPGAYLVWNELFSGTGIGILIQDNENMTMYLATTGVIPNAVDQALFAGGYVKLKPAGVGVTYFVPFDPTLPYFGLDVENSVISGLDVGAFGAQL